MTAAGKAGSARNALVHGLRAERLVAVAALGETVEEDQRLVTAVAAASPRHFTPTARRGRALL